jgi:crotonobetainyl-CoA:carnitine CoA-transferase CaiB-like acyl-CoA transferase
VALPLEGIRVIDMTRVIAGPHSGSILRQLGADVVKIEPPTGDPLRMWGSAKGTMIFSLHNSGKRSVALDLRRPEAVDVVKRLLATADVLLLNARAGQMDKLGLSYEACKAVNPRLVYVSLTGFGTEGPFADDSIGQSFGGLLGLNTQGMERPVVGPPLGDVISGIVMAWGALAGLAQRGHTGEGVRVDSSLVEAVMSLIPDAFVDEQADEVEPDWRARGRRSQILILTARDDRDLVIHLSTSQRFFENLCTVLGRDELVSDPRFVEYAARWEHYDELRDELASTFATRDRGEWEDALLVGNVPYSPVHKLRETRTHPQIEALGLFDSFVPGTDVALPKIPLRFDEQRLPRPTIAPELGEHTRDVLATVLDDAELQSLIERGIAFDGAPSPDPT